jgi:hypothetical protein
MGAKNKITTKFKEKRRLSAVLEANCQQSK